MITDNTQAHPALPHVSEGGRTDVSPPEVPPNHQAIDGVRRVLISCHPQAYYQLTRVPRPHQVLRLLRSTLPRGIYANIVEKSFQQREFFCDISKLNTRTLIRVCIQVAILHGYVHTCIGFTS